MVQEQLVEQVILHKTIPHEELISLVHAIDISVITSTSEGFPLAPAEAMALAKPVIATNVGGVTDLIENGVSGLLVPSGDAVSLADKIAQLMTNPKLREQLGQAGRKRIETCFSVDVIANCYMEYYST
ncbi:glycosyltransferase family 4 protein [Lutibacter sp.]